MNTILSLTDITKLLQEDLKAIEAQLTNIAGVDAAIVADYVLRTQNRMAIVMAGFAKGELSGPDLKNFLEDEKLELTGFLYTLEVIGKVDIQSFLQSAVTSIAGIIIKIILPVAA